MRDDLSIAELQEKNAGLQAELDAAVAAAYQHGAVCWAVKNYPNHPLVAAGIENHHADVAESRGQALAEQALDRVCRDEYPAIIEGMLEVLNDLVFQARKHERKRCIAAVAVTVAPIQGTPYAAGSRRFVEAIEALPLHPVDLATIKAAAGLI